MPTSRVTHSLFLTFEIAAKCGLHMTILQADSLNQPMITKKKKKLSHMTQDTIGKTFT